MGHIRASTCSQEHTQSVTSVAFSPDGGLSFQGGDDTIRPWDVSEWVKKVEKTPNFDGKGQVDFADFFTVVANFGTKDEKWKKLLTILQR